MSDGRTWGTIVGGVVGFFTAGVGFAAGAAIGGAVGGLLEPKQRTETNRIDDIKVSLSKYGDGIPETWGNNIPSATCVWSTYIIELPEEPTGGKGGGVENTNYRQFIQSMWCLGRTPPPGATVAIRKVWINGKLNYDASSGLSVSQALATEENPWASIALLPGFDDQLPVPMIETYEGVGNVPAFRGRICVFIFGLECPGGRVPQIQFELCIDPSTTPTIEYGESFVVPAQTLGSQPMHSKVDGLPITLFTQDAIDTGAGFKKLVGVYALGENYLTKTRALTLDAAAAAVALPGAADIDAICQAWPTVSGADRGQLAVVEDTGTIHLLEVGTGFSARLENATWSKWGDRVVVSEDSNGTGRIALFAFESGALLAMITQTQMQAIWATPSAIFMLCLDPGTTIWRVDVCSPEDLTVLATAPLPVALSNQFFASPQADDTLFAVPPGTMDVWAIDASGSATFVDSGVGALAGLRSAPFSFKSDKVISWSGVAAAARVLLADLNVLEPQLANVEAFIESQNLRAGLSSDQIDLGDVHDSFWGMTLKSPASARANITPVMTYSAIGVVEEDGVLRYFRRKDKTSVATIPYLELGFAEDGSEPGDPFPLVRSNAQELPRSMTVSFNDPNFDYQVSTVKAFMPSAESGGDESQTLDMAISGERAQTVARRLLLERWISQISRSCAVSRAYAYLSAGDVITVLSRTGSYGDWMISKITDTGARIEIECFPADSDLLIQVVPGPSAYRAQQIEPLATPTLAVPLDTAIMRDADSNAGLYFALAGYGPNYPGGELFTGPNDGALTSRGQVANEAPMGVAETVLGAWSNNVVDETNLLTVNVGHHSLSSITRDVLLSGTENVAAVGAPGRWEIIKFQRASDLGGGHYLLSGLLRGMRGTEFAVSQHQMGDRFVVMGVPGMLRPNLDGGSIGQEQLFRAITLGRSFNSMASQEFTNTAEGLKPFSPVNLRKSFSGTDIVLTWSRRTRLTENAFAGFLPLGETSERYDVTIYSDTTFTTVKRVIQVFAETATYTAAQQIADFGATQTTINVRVQQRSDSIGLGHELQATA